MRGAEVNRLLVASLDRYGPLRNATRDDLMTCSQEAASFEPGQIIAPVGTRSRLRLLARGLAVRQQVLPDGGRQIFGIVTPGEPIDLAGLYVGMDYEVSALGTCEARMTTAHELGTLLRGHSDLLAALCRAVLTEGRQQRSWMVGLGRRSALARTAHLFCEVYWRQATLRLAGDGKCDFPAVQADIADALGLSVVHAHRVLRALRDHGLATLRHGVLRIGDWEALSAMAGFETDRLRPQQELDDAPARGS